MTDKYNYKAFISYSHRDERWASWLHHAIETYRLPRKLVGSQVANGQVPARVRPVFRDRDELSSAADLGDTVKQALADSENLVVICSPHSAASFWVNEEIRYFAGLGRADRIFCVIVDGEPPAPGRDSTCFPEALAEVGLREPLAADVRKWADGKHLSKLKLISGMLGLPLDQLRRRDLQKRQKFWALTTVFSIALATVMVTAITSQIAAEQRRASGELLVGYKLNELRTMLNVATNPEDLARLDEWDRQELDDLIAQAGEGETALVDHALELRKQGNGIYRKGDLAGALEKFRQSWALLAEKYRRDRGNQDVFFELGQAEFYIGQMLTFQGEIEMAEEALMSYAEITRRLIVKQPENAEWVLEMAYALNNLGVLEEEFEDGDPDRRLQLMQSALEYNQIALVLDPENPYYKSELGQSHAFLADAQLGVCDLDGALQTRQENVQLEREIMEAEPDNAQKVRRLAASLSGLALVREQMGDLDRAIEELEEANSLTEPVLLQAPEDKNILQFILERKNRLAMSRAFAGQPAMALDEMRDMTSEWRDNFELDTNEDPPFVEIYTYYLVNYAWLAYNQGDPELAKRLLDEAMFRNLQVLNNVPGHRAAGNLLMLAAFRYWEVTQQPLPENIMMQLPYYYSGSGRNRACFDAGMVARKAIMLGNTARAREVSAYLKDRGYAEGTFLRLCEKYSICRGQ